MRKRQSEPCIDIEARSLDEQDRRLVARAENEAIEIDKLGDTVRIHRPTRADTTHREMLQQPWLAE
jgi:hypothetical protein